MFLLLVLLFDSIELLRRASSSLMFRSRTMEMSFFGSIHWVKRPLPFAVLFGGMTAFWRLARTHELVITRAAGVSGMAIPVPGFIPRRITGCFPCDSHQPCCIFNVEQVRAFRGHPFKGTNKQSCGFGFWAYGFAIQPTLANQWYTLNLFYSRVRTSNCRRRHLGL